MTPRAVRPLLAVVLLAVPAPLAAQSSTAPPHPTMPWGGVTTPYGQLVRFIYIPPQPVTLEYVVHGPPPSPLAAEPPAAPETGTAPAGTPPAGPEPAAGGTAQIVRQQVTIPGYYVRETTVGYHYPERWAVEQAGPNVYRWRMLPAQFVPK